MRARQPVLPNHPLRGRPVLPDPEPVFPGDRPPPATYATALRGMVDRPFLASRKWQEQQQRAVRTDAYPDILEFERVFIKRMANLGVPMFAAEVQRTKERQDDLYALGVSKAKAGQSAHNFGCAVDIVHSVRGWDMSRKEWELIGHVGRELAAQRGWKLEWGGGWKFYDPAHWELLDWQRVKRAIQLDPSVPTAKRFWELEQEAKQTRAAEMAAKRAGG